MKFVDSDTERELYSIGTEKLVSKNSEYTDYIMVTNKRIYAINKSNHKNAVHTTVNISDVKSVVFTERPKDKLPLGLRIFLWSIIAIVLIPIMFALDINSSDNGGVVIVAFLFLLILLYILIFNLKVPTNLSRITIEYTCGKLTLMVAAINKQELIKVRDSIFLVRDYFDSKKYKQKTTD